ncbi:hypothetical protein [Sulfitobacter alexandrii]|nr:hypothetical protein [Sulfitobacter alexandrii]
MTRRASYISHMLAPIFFVIAVIAVAIYAHRHADTRKCRWREDRAGAKGALMRYHCVTCGAEAYRANGKPDKCLAGLEKPGL